MHRPCLQVEALGQQNSALKAAAARLSRALAEVMHPSGGSGGCSSLAACAGSKPPATAAAAARVLAELAAAEEILAGVH